MKKYLLNVTIALLLGFISFCIIKIAVGKTVSIPEEVVIRLKQYLVSKNLVDSSNSIIIYCPSTSCASCYETTMGVVQNLEDLEIENYGKIILSFDKIDKEQTNSILFKVHIIDPIDFERNGLFYSFAYVVVVKDGKLYYSNVISESTVENIHKKIARIID